MRSKKTQTAIEFIFLVGVAFSLTIIFLVATRSQLKELTTTEEIILVRDVGSKVQNEINLGARVEDRYTRVFEIPKKLETRDYNITINDNILVVATKNEEYVAIIPRVVGNIQKGNNIIKRIEGVVYLNQE